MQRLELAFHRSVAHDDRLKMSLLGAIRRGDPGTEPTPETTAPRVGRRYVESDHAARRRSARRRPAGERDRMTDAAA